MPTALTETASFDPEVPTPDDTEAATGAGLDAMAQPLANRTQYLKAIVESVGSKRISNVDSITALKALTGNTDKDVALVKSRGVYWFHSTATDAAAEPLIVVPDAGGGRWFHDVQGVAAIASGIATLDAASRLVQLPKPGIIKFDHAEVSAPDPAFSTTLATYQEAAFFELSSSTLAVGDILLSWWVFGVDMSAGTGSVRIEWAESGGASGNFSNSEVPNIGTTRQTLTLITGRPVTSTAAYRVKLMAKSDGTNTIRIRSITRGYLAVRN